MAEIDSTHDMTGREAFEVWADNDFYNGIASVSDTWSDERGLYTDSAHHMALKAWQHQAARIAQLEAQVRAFRDKAVEYEHLLPYLCKTCGGYGLVDRRCHDDPLGSEPCPDCNAATQALRDDIETMGSALADIASGEIVRMGCVGPNCTEELGIATADEMSSRAAGALEWIAARAAKG